MELIKFDNVSFSYKAVDDSDNAFDIPVLKNFNLSIEEGSFVAILGHNGSGKSTVAKLTNGILFADEGTVTVNGKVAVDDDSIYEIRRDAGMVFQNPDNQIVSSIVEEDVAFGVENPTTYDYYIDDTGRILIDFIYIDENNIPISEVHTKSLYNCPTVP